jgi:hypothetical protein
VSIPVAVCAAVRRLLRVRSCEASVTGARRGLPANAAGPGAPIFLGRELIRFAAARTRAGDTRGKLAALVDEALQTAEATGTHLIDQEAERYGLI